jgi:hypothetical protein
MFKHETTDMRLELTISKQCQHQTEKRLFSRLFNFFRSVEKYNEPLTAKQRRRHERRFVGGFADAVMFRYLRLSACICG